MSKFGDVKVGDKVECKSRFNPPTTVTVTKVTVQQFVAGGRRFRKSDGWEIGPHHDGLQRAEPVA